MSKSRIGYFVEEIDELPYIQQDTVASINEHPKKNHTKLILTLVLLISMPFHFKHGESMRKSF